jgi:hypothetical protein
MITAASAAAAMIGLLFVAVSFRSEVVFGPHAPARATTLAASSFTSLVNAFSLALLAVVPHTNVGVSMVVLGVLCFFNTWNLHARNLGFATQYRILTLSCLTYVAQIVGGMALLAHPHIVWIVNGLCYVIFASFAIALTRAWDLLKAELPSNHESPS